VGDVDRAGVTVGGTYPDGTAYRAKPVIEGTDQGHAWPLIQVRAGELLVEGPVQPGEVPELIGLGH
jgi:hypothetical protein